MPTKYKKLAQVASAGRVYWDCLVKMTPNVSNREIAEMVQRFEADANQHGFSLHKTHLRKYLIDWRNDLRRQEAEAARNPAPASEG